MSVTLSIKNVPDDVARALRDRAVMNQRTLQEELLQILKEAAKGQSAVTMDNLLAKAERKKPALDEAALKVQSARAAEQQRVTQRFEDLLGGASDEPSHG